MNENDQNEVKKEFRKLGFIGGDDSMEKMFPLIMMAFMFMSNSGEGMTANPMQMMMPLMFLMFSGKNSNISDNLMTIVPLVAMMIGSGGDGDGNPLKSIGMILPMMSMMRD